ncbi:hypothetical protein T4E_5207 [Trichinella pseudospiralis]|uniref:Uncharacterized protein n=1 Tax=Trichinella pseudospiralis TaxID=6337 RepID=A0A0V0YDN2_TRIPS|nr:hypothetical protein T4E_5207 [Trichinella pseudospiralis]
MPHSNLSSTSNDHTAIEQLKNILDCIYRLCKLRTGYTEAALRTRGKVVEKTGKQERKEFKTSHGTENVTNDCLTDCLSEGR